MNKILVQDNATDCEYDFLSIQPFEAIKDVVQVLEDINSIFESLNGTPLFIYEENDDGIFITSLHGSEIHLHENVTTEKSFKECLSSISSISEVTKKILLKVVDYEYGISVLDIIRELRNNSINEICYMQVCSAFYDYPPIYGKL